MVRVEEIKVESDERGWELHLFVDEDIEVGALGHVILNVHGVAEQLLSEVVTKIGPWMLEGLRVKREMQRARFDEEDDADLESSIFDMADELRDRERGK